MKLLSKITVKGALEEMASMSTAFLKQIGSS